MKMFTPRSLFTLGTFAVAACFVLTGCTDAFVGPDDALETNRTVVERSDEVAMQPAPMHERNDKLQMRSFIFPPPETTAPDEGNTSDEENTDENTTENETNTDENTGGDGSES